MSATKDVVTIKGSGALNVPLPVSVPLPAIVHAHHDGRSAFVVSGIDSFGQRTAILASARGFYDGTFAIGFVEAANNPTKRLRIDTRGPWRIDIGRAALATPIGRGQAGVGDTVLSYTGAATTAHLTFRAKSRMIVNLYENGGLVPVVDTKGPYDGPISLLAGPLFIAVMTTGKWSMIIEKR
jgi:hypothetical protein